MNKEYYDEEYFMKGTKSSYGYTKFPPYIKEVYLLIERKYARYILNNFRPKNALVLGCARGYLVRALRDLGIEAYGIDISHWAIENSDCGVEKYIYEGDCCNLSRWKDKQFDIVLAFDILEHIPLPDLDKAIEEACRVSRIYIKAFIPIIDNGVDKSHVSIFPTYWWIIRFRKCGFKADLIETGKQIDDITSLRVTFKRQY